MRRSPFREAKQRVPMLSILLAVVLCPRGAPAQEGAAVAPESAKASSSGKFVAAPLVLSAPAFGDGVGAMGMYFYRPKAAGEKSPPSAITMIGAYSDTDSYFLGVFNQNHLRNDRWRPRVGLANGKINNDFDIPDFGDVKFSTNVNALFGRLERRWIGNAFLGATASYLDVRYEAKNAAAKDYFRLHDVADNSSGQLGVLVSYDSRDNLRYPTRGMLSEMSLDVVPEWLGSTSGYAVLQLSLNTYAQHRPGHVLALRAYGRFTPEDTPYNGLSTLGQRSDLRGYTAGEKVAENLMSAQAEYRWMFKPRWGVVAFAGVATLYDGGIGNVEGDNTYLSGGLGLRYVLDKANRVNFRVDFAWGEDDDSGYYVSMGEAF